MVKSNLSCRLHVLPQLHQTLKCILLLITWKQQTLGCFDVSVLNNIIILYHLTNGNFDVSDTLSTDYGSGNMLYVYQLGQYSDYGSRNYLIRDDLSTTFQYFE